MAEDEEEGDELGMIYSLRRERQCDTPIMVIYLVIIIYIYIIIIMVRIRLWME